MIENGWICGKTIDMRLRVRGTARVLARVTTCSACGGRLPACHKTLQNGRPNGQHPTTFQTRGGRPWSICIRHCCEVGPNQRSFRLLHTAAAIPWQPPPMAYESHARAQQVLGLALDGKWQDLTPKSHTNPSPLPPLRHKELSSDETEFGFKPVNKVHIWRVLQSRSNPRRGEKCNCVSCAKNILKRPRNILRSQAASTSR